MLSYPLQSGRLFARNLSYCATETDLEALFGKYGKLSEFRDVSLLATEFHIHGDTLFE